VVKARRMLKKPTELAEFQGKLGGMEKFWKKLKNS
jgi:hypothetical protein